MSTIITTTTTTSTPTDKKKPFPLIDSTIHHNATKISATPKQEQLQQSRPTLEVEATAAAAAAAKTIPKPVTFPSIPPWHLVRHDSLEWRSTRRDNCRSRHKTEFMTLEKLGQGAFGIAHKVQNQVDSQVYCLKRVLLPSPSLTLSTSTSTSTSTFTSPSRALGATSTDKSTKSYQPAVVANNEKLLREVQVLATIQSDHVVRYYSAWVEQGEIQQQEQQSKDNPNYDINDNTYPWTFSASSTTISSSSEAFATCHLCDQAYTEWEVSFEHWGLIDAVLQPLDLCIPCYKKSIPKDGEIDPDIQIRQTTRIPRNNFLFILMEYCEQTLQDAIQLKELDDSTKWDYFIQCIQGVAHLHSKGIIHRDIKPNNIFIHNGIVKIGDFGLATIVGASSEHTTTTTTTTDSSKFPSSYSNTLEETKKSSQVGTALYSAPEVVTGKYNEKCDIYSLGIVLVELFSNFKTYMERAQVLRDGLVHLPLEWIQSHERQAQLAQRMVQRSPEDRPTCVGILKEWKMTMMKGEPPQQVVSLSHEPQQQQQQEQEKQQQQQPSPLQLPLQPPPLPLGGDCSSSCVEKERLEAMVTSLTQQVAQLEAKLKASETESMRLRKMLEDNGFSLEI